MAPKEWFLEADVVRLGAPTQEPVDDRRRQLHLWVARRLLNSVRERRPATTTKYLPPEQIRSYPRLLGELLDLPNGGDEQTVAVIDCSLNHYEDLGENILYSVALCAAGFAASPGHVCIVLLPRLPHSYHSSFWEPLNELSISGGSVLVLNNEGKFKVHGGPRPKAEQVAPGYGQRQQELIGSRQQEFDDKIIRKMGHFEINDEYCSRYFFDGSRTVQELSHLLVDRITHLVGSRPSLARTELIVPETVDPWMEDAVAVASGKLRMRQTKWPSGGDRAAPDPDEHTQYLVMLDFVNTGSTYRRIIKEALGSGYNLHRYAVAAFMARDFQTEDDLPELSPIKRVRVDRVPRRDCVQCKIGLPFTNKDREELLRLRSYDAWEVLSHVPWIEETYGPPEHLRQKSNPDFVRLFEEFGDYLAYKLEMVLRHLVPGSAVAVACPEEPGILAVVKRMQPWADNRIVAVRVPRSVLEKADRSTSAEIRQLAEGHEWSRQLAHLAERNVNVVVVDEQNGSNRTARQMIKVLESFHLRPKAYLPVFNFVPSETLDGVRVVALYDVPRPRRMDP
ncbi:hypothetical protein [Actinophytocola xanthii]|uniref:Uncharacterized protein n=1 Tax=Actinophytocola xanthii TaxID=1912961 RepID=A0A1Q8C6B1_9PSEU|nr:hypothetical protein [Actinophytocola xanthii]OLF09877.1 hypothetical protein BU204_32555 [Actinophytocola xanthii]